MQHWLGKEVVVFCGLALLVGGGYWQGRQSGRWTPLVKPQSANLSVIPHDLEGWKSTDFEMDRTEAEIGGIDASLGRHYEHLETGEVVTVLILEGPGGPISVHPPEVCFASHGYEKESKIVQVSLPGSDAHQSQQFDMAVFRGPESTEGHRVQLFWSWSTDGNWSVPANPRLVFAREPRLYKIYVSRSLQPMQDRQEATLCLNLLSQLVPEISRCLSRSATDSSSPEQESALETGKPKDG